jgi:hypothetical protein
VRLRSMMPLDVWYSSNAGSSGRRSRAGSPIRSRAEEPGGEGLGLGEATQNAAASHHERSGCRCGGARVGGSERRMVVGTADLGGEIDLGAEESRVVLRLDLRWSRLTAAVLGPVCRGREEGSRERYLAAAPGLRLRSAPLPVQRRGEEGRGGGHRHARARGLRLVFWGEWKWWCERAARRETARQRAARGRRRPRG